MGKSIEKFLESKVNSSSETTHYCSLLLLTAKGRKDLLSSFTLSKVKEVLAERREEKWANLKND